MSASSGDGSPGHSIHQALLAKASEEKGCNEMHKTIEDSPEIIEKETDWRSVALAAALAFLMMVEANIVSMAEWPYMMTLDPEATSSFFGGVTSICKFGDALFVLVFAGIAHRFKVTRLPLLAGRLFSLAGCILYLCVEWFPTNRRYVLITCYLMFGIGSSPVVLLRNYVSHCSGEKERTRVFALFSVAGTVSIIIGPIFQLAFSGVAYPGYEVVGKMRFHLYSAPITVAVLFNLVIMYLVLFQFKEHPRIQRSGVSDDSSSSLFSLEGVREKFDALKGAPFSWLLVGVLIAQKSLSVITLATLQAIVGPQMTTIFAFDGPMIVRVLSVVQILIGVLAVSLSCLFIFAKLDKWISNRTLFALTRILMIALYVASFPWPMWSHPLQPYDPTTLTGCNPSEYSWCNSALAASPWIQIFLMTLVMGFGVPATNISLDAIYSRVLGNIDQNLMQSVCVLAENVVAVFGPLYAASLFTAAGIAPIWIINGVIASLTLLLWIAVWKPLGKYQ